MARALRRRPVAVLAATAFAATAFAATAVALGSAQAAGGREAPYAALDLFARVLTQVDESYVEAVPQREIVYKALEGADNALDTHSVFLNPDAYRRMRDESEGQYVGIGAQTREDPRGLRVLSVVRDGPAARAGIAAEDLIVTVEGTRLAGMNVDEATELVRGREGEAVTLGVERGAAVRAVPLLRTRVLEASAETELLDSGIAYLRVRQFREGTAAALAAGVAGMPGTIRGGILDLRSNPGGRLDEAVATSDLFVRAGRIVSTRGRRPGGEEVWDATDQRGDWDWPLIVLVNGESASAAEIVTGALQDLHRAKILGERTYGKGSVQSVFEYEDGSALKLTIARYYLPSGRAIEDRAGIAPDETVLLSPAEGPVDRLRKAVGELPSAADRARLGMLLDQIPAEPVSRATSFAGTAAERLSTDPQLKAAYLALTTR